MKPAATRRIADRLASAQDARFIGRKTELAFFGAALVAETPPFTVLHVHGAGGIGKTTLLREFARMASKSGRAIITLDGRDIHLSTRGFLEALAGAVGGPDEGLPADRLSAAVAVPDRALLIIDTYEKLSVLDTWLREALLPTLPASSIVVLAGREAPTVPWRTDVAWTPLTQVVELSNFTIDESAAFLESRGVAAPAHESVLSFTHGHPLALSLTASLLASRPDTFRFDAAQAPDVVRHLLALFVETVPPGPYRAALDICAVARVTTEPLLTELLGTDDGRAAFQWLRVQSFMESRDRGVFPHDLVREVLIADASWRDSDGLRALAGRIRVALYQRMRAARGHEQLRLQMDAIYAARTNPSNLAYFDWGAMDGVRAEVAEPHDAEWIVELVRRHEGPASAELAQHWWRVQPGAFHVFFGQDDARFGFLVLLEMEETVTASESHDPALVAARAFVERHAPLARGDKALYLRWWMHAETYQAVTAAINLTAAHVVRQCTTRPEVAWNFVSMADPSFWAAHFEGVNFARVPDADFEVGGRCYGVFAHEWRIEPAADWVARERVPMPFARSAGAGGASAPVLTEAEFRDAVREALHDYTRVDRLAASRLRFARIVERTPGVADRAAALQLLLRESAAQLKSNPRDLKLYRAVWHTYFEPLATQELVAERLGLPFSTYRRHLRQAIERVGSSLWHRERAAPPTQ